LRRSAPLRLRARGRRPFGQSAQLRVLRFQGAGHSAAIHSQDPQTILDFGAAVPVLRISVNVGNSLGSSGLQTNLPPSMTIGTGYVGRSSVGENLQPDHLVNWTRLAYNSDVREVMPDYAGRTPWVAHTGAVPAYPIASNAAGSIPPVNRPAVDERAGEIREEIRRLIIEELHQIIKG